MTKEPKTEYPSSTRVVTGVITMLFAVINLLSLLSYDWRDIAILQTPANLPPSNWIGPLGAWSAFLALNLAGIGAFVVPIWLMIIGTLLIVYRGNIRKKTLWIAISLGLFASVVDLHGGFRIREAYNLAHEGGLLGWMITHGLLIRWLSPLGAGLILWSLLLAALLMAIGPHNVYIGMQYAIAGSTLGWEFLTSKYARLDSRNLEMEKEARVLRREQARLEKELRKQARAEASATKSTQNNRAESLTEDAEPGKKRLTAELRTAGILKKKPTRKKSSDIDTEDDDDLDITPKGPPLPPPVIDPDKAQFPNYQLPPLSLLNEPPREGRGNNLSDNQAIGVLLVQTLDEFGISAEISSIKQGPVVTRYEILPARGVRVERIAALSNNLALALKAHSLRVQAPVPGKGVVGIEVPNETAKMVLIRDLIECDEWRAGTARLPLVLGKDVGGKNVIADLAKMPHLLVAGATGAGKSVCINSMLSGLFMCKTPDELRLILVDPKIVEFSIYNDLPHLVVPVITDPKKVALSLRWAITEMENRYKMFAKARVRNIEGFNNRHTAFQGELFTDQTTDTTRKDDLPPSVPYIVIVIDELADLMLAAGAEIENSIARLAQLSRAVGIHMIIATQRPSVNVITGTIKANFPARIAFQVAQKVDSRTILDQSGADKLLGQGDMLYAPPASSKLIRAQGAMITDQEVERLVNFMKEQAEPAFEMEIKNKLEKSSASPDSMDDGEDDELVEQAIAIIRETSRASTSSLQRRMRIGYTRAARIIDILEERGIVGPPCGAGPREILIDLDVETDDEDFAPDDETDLENPVEED
ncbi:MAG: DNA translocase FtsK 4TM domain-containing protein [Kiritimatiellia bacterium]